jgi:hypothetical protein
VSIKQKAAHDAVRSSVDVHPKGREVIVDRVDERIGAGILEKRG